MVQGNSVEARKVTSDKNSAIGLNRNCTNEIAGTEANVGRKIRIHGTIGVQTSEPVQRCAVEIGKGTADQHFTRIRRVGGVNRQSKDRTTGTETCGERIVHRAVVIQTHDAGAGRTVIGRECTASINLGQAANKV